jgi:hypothetical protein
MASRPNSGRVGPIASINPPPGARRPNARTEDGTWRPRTPFRSNVGLRITMSRASGLTPDGVLHIPLRFQVPALNDLRRSYQANWATYDTVSGGQRSRPMGAQLLSLQVDTMLLDHPSATASESVVVWDGAPDPQRVLAELRYIAGVDDARKGKAAPFRLVIEQPVVWDKPVVTMVATLTTIEPSLPANEIGTEYLSATFLEYAEQSAGQQRRHAKPPQRHTLRRGDTLHELAKRYLHQASAWRQIAKANGITGVRPGSASDLAAWAKRHHKTTLVIPRVELVSPRAGINK